MKTSAAWERLANAIGCLRGWPDEEIRDAVDAFDALGKAPPPDAAALVTEAELAEVERLDAEATPGPWCGEVENERRGWHTVRAGRTYVLPVATVTITKSGESYEESGIRIQPGDLSFITNARTLLPRLAAEVRRLTAAVAKAQADLARVAGGTPDQQIEAWKAEAHEQEDAAEDAEEDLEEAEGRLAEALAEVGERDAQIARLAVESDATEAALRTQIAALEKLAADRAEALVSSVDRCHTLADEAEDARNGELISDEQTDAVRTAARLLLDARSKMADEGGIITGCSTAALVAYNTAALDLAETIDNGAGKSPLHILRRLEWSGTADDEEGGTVTACPWCAAESRGGVHVNDCELAAAIGAKLATLEADS